MRAVYPLEVVSGHLIAQIGDTRAFLDTGAPISIGRGRLSILDRTVALHPEGQGFTLEYMTDKIGTRVDALLGTDVLSGLFFEVDYGQATCTFDTERGQAVGCRVPLQQFLNTPIVYAAIDGEPVRMIVDTGAHLGYLAPSLVAGRRPFERRHDFNPALGDFTTDVYQVTVVVGGLTMSLPFGVMPPALEMMTRMIGTPGILGSDIFRHHKTLFAMPDGELVFSDATG